MDAKSRFHDGDLLAPAASRLPGLRAWRLPPTQRLRRPADTPARVTAARKVESSIRAYGLASQCRLCTPAIEAANHLLPFSAVNARLRCWFVQPSDRRSADVSVHTVEGHL